MIALNMWDVAGDKNITININDLSRILGVAVVATTAISGEGIKELVTSLDDARPVEIDNIINNVGGLT